MQSSSPGHGQFSVFPATCLLHSYFLHQNALECAAAVYPVKPLLTSDMNLTSAFKLLAMLKALLIKSLLVVCCCRAVLSALGRGLRRRSYRRPMLPMHL